MSGPVEPSLDRDAFPALHEAASKTSREAQARFIRGTAAQLVLAVIAATIAGAAAVAGHLGGGLGPVSAGIALLGSAGIRTFLLATRAERDWYDGRAAAESAKTLAWKYAVGGIPFAVGTPDVDALFSDRLRDAMRLFGGGIAAGGERGVQITQRMREVRAGELERRRLSYDTDRLADQYTWYSRRSNEHKQRALAWNAVALGAQIGGGIAAILLAQQGSAGAVVAVASALAASAVAWLQTKQYDSTSRAYAVAAQELASIRSLLPSVSGEGEWSAFVDDAEEAISREHTTWRARRGI